MIFSEKKTWKWLFYCLNEKYLPSAKTEHKKAGPYPFGLTTGPRSLLLAARRAFLILFPFFGRRPGPYVVYTELNIT